VTVRPTLDGWATFDLGPYLPNFRHPTDTRVGVEIDVGKTTAEDYDLLVQRYAVIAAAPDSQVDKLRDVTQEMVLRGALAGALIGLSAPVLILLVGRRRWNDLAARMSLRRGLVLGLVVALGCAGLYVAFPEARGQQVESEQWQPLQGAVPAVPLPEEATRFEVDRNLLTTGSARLVESLVTSYRSSLTFYTDLEALAAEIGPQLRDPAEDETVALLVSDRHDNINMDPVAREVAEQGGASIVIDAGDDTSTGSAWEMFSLESLAHTFEDLEGTYAVAGDHDHGNVWTEAMPELGVTTLVGETVDGPDDIRFFGASDPRSAGLGAWKDEKGITMEEQETLIADLACAEDAAGRRISTIVVHDLNTASEALARGCVDLVVAGHRHEQVGPLRVLGSNGKVGYSYINGTTGGAAFAIALGSKLRRDAQVTLVTYRDGRPVGIQPVIFRTVKEILVSPYVALELPDEETDETAPAP
jgi:hypothetical protein